VARIECVLFDLDGTLLDHRGSASAALNVALARWVDGRLDPDEATLERTWFELEALHMATYLRGDCSFEEQRRRRMREFRGELGLQDTDDPRELDEMFGTYLKAYETHWTAYEDAETCLVALGAQTRLGVLTNGDHGQQTAKLARIGLLRHFEMVLTPSQVGAAKPSRVAFNNACAAMGVRNSRTAYVGDDLDSDAVGAQAAGLIGVWLDHDDATPQKSWHGPRVTSLAAVPGRLVELLRARQGV